MDNTSRPPSYYEENAGFRQSSIVGSMEMNDVLPRNAPVAGATAVSYAVERFENTHITIFQVRVVEAKSIWTAFIQNRSCFFFPALKSSV